MRVLVVDDAAFMRRTVGDIIRSAGHIVAGEAENGADAIEKYMELLPDVVLMDITMPEMSGLEALRAIRHFDSEARVIMCSAMGQQAMVKQAILTGAIEFIVKPFLPGRIESALEKLK